MKTYKPYCYLIGWSKLDVWYYGSEFANRTKIANPSNLWVSYFTSSKKVKLFRQLHGEPDIIQIRKVFENAIQTIHWEYRVLRRLKVKHSKKWLNINEGKAPVGTPWTTHRKNEHSKNVKGENNPMFGKTHSDTTKKLIAERSRRVGPENGMYGKKHTDQSKLLMGANHQYASGKDHHMFGKNHSKQTIEKMILSKNALKYNFVHPTYGSITETLRHMISTYPGLKGPGLRALTTRRLKTYKGWYVQTDEIS